MFDINKANEWAVKIHENAKAHGWWDEERSDGEILALCHSELSEALEEYRNDKPMIYYVDGKPEGIAVELADCVIRILDCFAYKNHTIDRRVNEHIIYNYQDLGTFISDMHATLSTGSKRCYNYKEERYLELTFNLPYGMEMCVYEIHGYLKANNVDLWEIVKIKHEYNVTRPYRHGGKVI